MNHTYRPIFNAALGAWIAAPETARGRGKGRAVKSAKAAAAVLSALTFHVHALPTGGSVSAGSGSVATAGSTMTVTQTSQNLAINWQSFNVGAGETATFVQPNAAAIALNRVLGVDGTQILGNLNANGQVWILNPNGVLFGKTAQVNVGGLVASTLNISDADFLAGKRTFTGMGGSVINQGEIVANYVALLGEQVGNEGVIVAKLGTVALAAGNQVTLDFAGDKLLGVQIDEGALHALVDNKNLIQADGGLVVMTARAKDALLDTAVNNTGVVRARTLENRAGKILLLGDMQSGTANVAGTLDASAPNGGNGANGGWIETSAAHVHVADGTIVTTKAENGQSGTWLIDPNDYTIAAIGGDISGATLSANLAGGNIEIQSSTGATAGNGDIHVNDAVSWIANTLTLTAARDVNINAVMTASNTAALTLNPATANGVDGAVAGGTVNVGLTDAGFTGRVDFFQADGVTPRSGTGFLTINGNGYTVITDLGAAGSFTTTDLQGMNGNLAGRYALGANIDASATSGWNSGQGFLNVGMLTGYFTGDFNGLGHTVSGLTIDRPNKYAGLFGRTSSGVALRNVGVVGGSITGDGYVLGDCYAGGLVGENQGTVSHSYASADVSATAGNSAVDGSPFNSYVGGLVGYNAGAITDSYSTGAATATNNVGGLVGRNFSAITNSYSTGAVSGSTNDAGGLVGYNEGTGTITVSYSTSAVTATNNVGGLVGSNHGAITDSYSAGAVTGTNDVGGLVGRNYSAITNAYSTGAVSGSTNYAGGLVGYNEGTGTVTDSYSASAVTGHYYAGGLVGYNVSGALTDSHSTGSVTAAGVDVGYIGGLVGYNNSGAIGNSYSTGNVTAGNADGSSATVHSVGGLVGHNVSGTIASSHSTGSVTAVGVDIQDIGGLAGHNSGAIDNSYSESAVLTGNTGGSSDYVYDVGGLVGKNVGAITDSYSAGSVTAGNADGSSLHVWGIGGLVGFNYTGITNSYSTGSVMATGIDAGYIGGLVGYNDSGAIAIGNSYSTGNVTAGGAYSVGGLVGHMLTGTVSASFWNSDTSGVAAGVGVLAGGTFSATGKTTAEMKQLATFSGWDIDDAGGTGKVWRIYDGYTAPLLRGFLTLLNAQPAYDGSGAALTNVGAYAISGGYDAGQVLGTTSSLTLSGTVADSYTATLGTGLYSTQKGYDLVTYRTISTPGSAAGDVVLANPITWTSGTLIIDAANDININAVLTASNTAALTMTTGGTVNVGLTDSGFTGRVDFFQADGTTPRAGNGFLTINGNAYTVITDLGAAGSVTTTDLQGMSGNLAGYYALGANIDASATSGWNSGQGFLPVGEASPRFTGVFDGLGHTVSGLTINRVARSYVGLFGNTDGALRNVGVVGGSVTGGNYVGGLAGALVGTGTVSHSYASANVSGIASVGGLVGWNSGGTVSGSHAAGNVSGTNSVGGLVGKNSGTVSDSHVTSGSVTASGVDLGGLVGGQAGTLDNSHYDIDSVTLNGATGEATPGGLYGGQYLAWLSNGKALDVASYFSLDGGGYYRVGSVQALKDLLGFADQAAYKFRLTADLALPAGYMIPKFAAAEFDGGGHALSGLQLGLNNGYRGFIGWLDGGSVNDLGLTGVAVDGAAYIGALAGYNNGGTVSNSYATGTVSGSSSNVGGLVGYNFGSTVSNSYATVAVSGNTYVGGLVGYNIVGSIVSNSYATGAVSGTSSVGGLVGGSNGGTVTASFWDTQTSGRATSAGGTGKTTAQMRSLATYAAWGADIDNAGGTGAVWRIYDGYTTPLLRGFLTALNVQPTYDGSGAALTNIAAHTISGAYDASKVLGNASTLTLANFIMSDGYSAVLGDGIYSTQDGYDLTGGFRTISTPGSAAGDIVVGNPITWTSGTLAINAVSNILVSAAISGSGSAIFEMQNGWWEQNQGGVGSLAPFAAVDFRLTGGTFIRALDGDGGFATPLQVADVYGLQGMGSSGMLANRFVLANDIDASGTANWNAGAGFKPVGDSGTPFQGGFDGQNHTIDSLFINRPTTDYVGLFGLAGSGIANVGLSNANITGRDRVGGLAGHLDDTTLSGSYVTGSVSGANYVGGAVGYGNFGGISNSYSTASVSGTDAVGGLIGHQINDPVSNSYATGAVSGATNVGGLIGSVAGSTASNSYWDTQTSGQATSAGGAGAVGKTTAQMKQLATFAAWDIDDAGGTGKVWRIYDGYTTPLLRGFMTSLNALPDYDGSGAALAAIGAYGISGSYDAGKVLGTAANSLTLSSSAANAYTATLGSGLYSTQQGYDLVTRRTIATAGSAAGDIALTNAISWTGGTLAINTTGTITETAAINGSGTAIFDLQAGTWNQVNATLPGFAAHDFRVSGGRFVRALGGDGTVGTPYQLADIYGVQGMRTSGMLGLNYTLANNVDASGTVNWNSGLGFVPVGDGAPSFTGIFDGLGHTVTGLTVNRPTTDYVGLFGYSSGTLRNVGLLNGSISGRSGVGTLAGLQNGGSISYSYADGGTVNGTGNAVGGLVGSNTGSIDYSYANVSVTGGGTATGGLAGGSAGNVGNSYATGSVLGKFDTGGLLGQSDGGTISNSYATGAVSWIAGGNGGGLIGGNLFGLFGGGTVSNSYWDTQTSGQATSAGGTGKTTAQMQTLSSFNTWSIANDGGSAAVWRIYEGNSTPLLRNFLTALTVTANAAATTYSGNAWSGGNGVSYSVAPNANLLGTVSYNGTSQGAVNAGSYVIAPSGLYSNQRGYDIGFADGVLTVNQANLTVTANAATKTVDGLTWSGGNGLSYAGFAGGENESVLGGTLAWGGTSQGAINVGSYVLTPSGLTAGNYAISFVGGTLTIAGAVPTVPGAPPDGYAGAVAALFGGAGNNASEGGTGSTGGKTANDSPALLASVESTENSAAPTLPGIPGLTVIPCGQSLPPAISNSCQ